MKNMTISGVVSSLIGYTEPYGDANVDIIRFNNQEELINLCRDIIETLQDNSKYYDRVEGSMCSIGTSARRYLIELREDLNDFLAE